MSPQMHKVLQEHLQGEEVATIILMQERGMRYGGNNDKELDANGSSEDMMDQKILLMLIMHKYF